MLLIIDIEAVILKVQFILEKYIKLNVLYFYFVSFSSIPLPSQVHFSEPLSFLQRIAEDVTYYQILENAAACTDSRLQAAYVAAFATSSYASTALRTTKPFNPMLGETYECDRRAEFGWRSLLEQVSDGSVYVHVQMYFTSRCSGTVDLTTTFFVIEGLLILRSLLSLPELIAVIFSTLTVHLICPNYNTSVLISGYM